MIRNEAQSHSTHWSQIRLKITIVAALSTWINSINKCLFNVDYVLWLFFSLSVMSDSLWPHGLQCTRLPCLSQSPRVCANSCPLSWWCHPTISVSPFSSCLEPFPVSGSFPLSWLFASGGLSIGASASATVLPKNIKVWNPVGLTGLISLLSKGISKVFSSTTIQKHQFFSPQPFFFLPNSHIHTWPLDHALGTVLSPSGI